MVPRGGKLRLHRLCSVFYDNSKLTSKRVCCVFFYHSPARKLSTYQRTTYKQKSPTFLWQVSDFQSQSATSRFRIFIILILYMSTKKSFDILSYSSKKKMLCFQRILNYRIVTTKVVKKTQ